MDFTKKQEYTRSVKKRIMDIIGIISAIIHVIGGVFLLINLDKSWLIINRKIIGIVILAIAVFDVVRLF